MGGSAEKVEDIRALMALFAQTGALEGGGVTRLGYSPIEDEMHRIFRDWGEREGFIAYTDAVGNSYLENDAATAAAEPPELPPGTRSRSRGLRVMWKPEFSVEPPIANSSRFALPISTGFCAASRL